jgi:ATP-dependent RNA helicase HrpB
MQSLPIDSLIPEIVGSLHGRPNLVVEAPPGSGKTTRIPPALLGTASGEVWVLEPRRLAARLAARRVAAELGEKPGETVGYQVRFEEVSGPRTRLRFLTEGVLTRKLLSNPRLDGVGVVVLDEFHERHLEGDLALALLLRLQRTTRPDLRLVVMSATIEAAPIAAHLGSCPVLRAEGRLFELSVEYSPVSPDPLDQQVAAAVRRLLRGGGDGALAGDVLVFLPGAAEIRRALAACEPFARQGGFLLAPLYGDLSPEEQDRAISPADRPKIILSTNVAESSVTIEGVRAVIDSGLARISGHSAWSGLPTLTVSRVSKAAANQRAGRAGRTGPGRVIRLYPIEDFQRRPEQETPEIEREDLAQVYLHLTAMGIEAPALPWLDAPPVESLLAAGQLLQRLGAFDTQGRLAGIGREMAALPLHPRLGRLVVEAKRRGVAEDGCAIAALISSGERLPPAGGHVGPSDLLFLLDQPWSGRMRRVFEQIRRAAGLDGRGSRKKPAEHDAALRIAVLTAFPDRLARGSAEKTGASRRQHGEDRDAGRNLLLAGGGGAVLARSSVVRRAGLLVAVEAEERRDQGWPLVRLASAVEPEWLLDLYPERMEERNTVEWNRFAERVESVSALLFDGLAIEESRSGQVDAEAAARLLAEKAWEAGIDRFADREALDAWLERVRFASEHAAFPAAGEEDLRAVLAGLCEGLRSFAELQAASRGGGFVRAVEARLSAGAHQLLEKLAPEWIRLPGGRRTRVHYESGKPPWVASRLQDFFGMTETPRVAGGKVPLVVHLLAPNQRPVQMTTDLAGFWARLYPELRRQLSRRYPKHRWPEKP